MTTRHRVAECTMAAPGPCEHRSCRYHLQHKDDPCSHVGPVAGCSLDVARAGEHTLEEVGVILGITRERARQIESRALGKIEKLAAGWR